LDLLEVVVLADPAMAVLTAIFCNAQDLRPASITAGFGCGWLGQQPRDAIDYRREENQAVPM
jgi:hypothetical protein